MSSFVVGQSSLRPNSSQKFDWYSVRPSSLWSGGGAAAAVALRESALVQRRPLVAGRAVPNRLQVLGHVQPVGLVFHVVPEEQLRLVRHRIEDRAWHDGVVTAAEAVLAAAELGR